MKMNSRKLYILFGPPGAGKSTFLENRFHKKILSFLNKKP